MQPRQRRPPTKVWSSEGLGRLYRSEELMEDQGHQAVWSQMIAALAAIEAALGLPADGCNSTAQTLAAIARHRDARGMLVARLENMQAQGDTWLTVQAVLALMNDCDMLAARERLS
jgi:hypothetical protein